MKKANPEYEKAKTIKKYGIDYSYLEKKLSPEKKKEKELKSKAELLKIKEKDFELVIIESLKEYQKIVSDLPNDPKFPIFYRGQNNSNYLLVPSSLRSNTNTEHLLLQEFCRRFPDEMRKCNNAMEKLVLMQHYGLHTRCLDITEAPLPALYFACADFKKFTQNSQSNMDKWGEILLFKAENEEDQKYPDSNTVSIMANTAFLKETFSMKELEIKYKQDNHLGALEDCINMNHVLHHSVIVRTAQNNPRIRNQQGAFILVNSNYCCSSKIYRKHSNPKNLSGKYLFDKEFSKFKDYYDTENEFVKTLIEYENTGGMKGPCPLENITNIVYKKTTPYDQSDDSPEYVKKDPFDIDRLFYRKPNGKRLIILIPPYAKKNILKQLEQNNIREDFIYPDMDTVSNELNNTIG